MYARHSIDPSPRRRVETRERSDSPKPNFEPNPKGVGEGSSMRAIGFASAARIMDASEQVVSPCDQVSADGRRVVEMNTTACERTSVAATSALSPRRSRPPVSAGKPPRLPLPPVQSGFRHRVTSPQDPAPAARTARVPVAAPPRSSPRPVSAGKLPRLLTAAAQWTILVTHLLPIPSGYCQFPSRNPECTDAAKVW